MIALNTALAAITIIVAAWWAVQIWRTRDNATSHRPQLLQGHTGRHAGRRRDLRRARRQIVPGMEVHAS